jgi:peptidoglycan hydrolase-like protein with peptidoglycan-binding domain
MGRITRTEFHEQMRGQQVDLNRVGDQTGLKGVDVQSADLNGDGVVHGEGEMDALFDAVDDLDRNGDRDSFLRSGRPGAALGALSELRSSPASLSEFQQTFDHGRNDYLGLRGLFGDTHQNGTVTPGEIEDAGGYEALNRELRLMTSSDRASAVALLDDDAKQGLSEFRESQGLDRNGRPFQVSNEQGQAFLARSDSDWASASRSDVVDLQTYLTERGFEPGEIDGAWGPNTRGALQRARQAQGVSAATPAENGSNSGVELLQRTGWADASSAEVRQLQTHLSEAGFDPGAIDGAWGPNTRAALSRAREAQGIDVREPVERPGDAWVVIYPDYEISTEDATQGLIDKAELGHTDLVTFEDGPGGTTRATLHQFGRYKSDDGNVQTRQIPLSLDLDPNTGDLTTESRNELLSYLSENFGKGGRVRATEIENIDLDAVDAFVDDFKARNAAGENDYRIWDNNCTTFAWEAAHAGSVDSDERDWLDGRGVGSIPYMSDRYFLQPSMPRYDFTPGEDVVAHIPASERTRET